MEEKTTPIKSTPDKKLPGFKPVNVAEQISRLRHQNITGLPRVTRDIAIDVHNNLQKWNESQVKGAQIIKKIVEEKTKNPVNYSPELEQHMRDLYEVVRSFIPVINQFITLTLQAKAVDNLQRKYETLFSSMDAQIIAEIIDGITLFYRLEYEEKTVVLKNIAHVKTKNELMFYASCWTLQLHIVDDIREEVEALLSDLGVRPIE